MSTKILETQIPLLDKYKYILNKVDTIRSIGHITEIIGNVVYSEGPDASLNELCHIEKIEEKKYILAEVIGFKKGKNVLSPLEDISGISPGCRVLSTGNPVSISVSDDLLGRVIDGLGNPLDKKDRVISQDQRFIKSPPTNPIERPLITESIETGVRAIDSLLTLGKGQRVGIFSGSGIGKSTLLGMISKYSSADVNVLALIGERGREVREFLERDLGEEGLKKSVVVVSTSNESPMQRVKAAYFATTIAEYFREKGKHVLLMMDSLTRLAMAQREIGLAGGEPATTRGYPPSVFSVMPELLERAGNSEKGSITGVYTVLVEADDMNDPIADAARGILDGHIILSRKLANEGHYPPIDIVDSISRSMRSVTSKVHYETALTARELLATYKENEEILNLGAYVKGSNPTLDKSILIHKPLKDFLKQKTEEHGGISSTIEKLSNILGKISS